MRDPYQVLGVSRSASSDELRKAYRKLAKDYHPDRNPGDPKAEERFKEAGAAFDLLNDPEKRAAFDRGEIGPDGQPRAPYGFGGAEGFANGRGSRQGFGFGGGGGPGGATRTRSRFFKQGGGFEDMGDILQDLFGDSFAGQGAREEPRQEPVRIDAEAPFAEVARAGKIRVNTPEGPVDVSLPPGLESGRTLRLRGKGPRDARGVARDVLVRVSIKPDPTFRLDGDDIRVDLPISLKEAVLGAKVNVPTVDGPVAVTIPKHADTSRSLRLRGRGRVAGSGKRGDQLVTLKIVLPDGPDAELEEFVRRWSRADEPVREA